MRDGIDQWTDGGVVGPASTVIYDVCVSFPRFCVSSLGMCGGGGC
jgi:hypothetical protein